MVPTSLKVVAILGIIYSGLILLATPCSMVLIFANLTPSPVTDALYHDRVYVGVTLALGSLSFILGIVLLASSIGCLKLKPWARMGMNVYAVSYGVLGLAGTIFQLVYVFPRMQVAMAAAAPGGPAALPPGLLAWSQIGGAIFGLLFMAGVVLTILIIVNRKIAVDAFNGAAAVPAGNLPVL